MNKFEKVVNDNIGILNQYVPIVKRVHGSEHPEFIDVADVYETFVSKLNNSENLEDEFLKFREITNNYEIPSDTCESYAAVYNMLKALDEAYLK